MSEEYDLRGGKIAPAEAAGLVLKTTAGTTAITPEERAALEQVAREHTSPAVKIARLSASGRVNRRDVEIAFNQTRLMGRGVSRIILEMLLEKATYGKGSAYDSEVLMFLAKGFGIVSPSAPVTDEDRAAQSATAERIAGMSDDELADDILNTVRRTHEAGRANEAEAKRIKRES